MSSQFADVTTRNIQLFPSQCEKTDEAVQCPISFVRCNKKNNIVASKLQDNEFFCMEVDLQLLVLDIVFNFCLRSPPLLGWLIPEFSWFCPWTPNPAKKAGSLTSPVNHVPLTHMTILQLDAMQVTLNDNNFPS